MKTKRYKLGEIKLKDSVYVSDPCYDTETWCQAFVENLKPGKYIGYMKKADFGPGGFGDSGYDLYARKNKEGQIIGLRINFINLHEEDDN